MSSTVAVLDALHLQLQHMERPEYHYVKSDIKCLFHHRIYIEGYVTIRNGINFAVLL